MSIDRSTFLPGVMLGRHVSTFLKSKLILYCWSTSLIFNQLKCTAESFRKNWNTRFVKNTRILTQYPTKWRRVIPLLGNFVSSYEWSWKKVFLFKILKDLSVFGDFADPSRGMGGGEGNDDALFLSSKFVTITVLTNRFYGKI